MRPSANPPRYAELHITTNFTFLEGASHPEEYVARAHELGLEAVAITDRNSLAGVVRAYSAARHHGQRIIIGAELVLEDGQKLIALPRDRAAYGRLSRLITLGRRRAGKGACELHAQDVAAHGAGQIFILLPPDTLNARFEEQAAFWAKAFPGAVYLAGACLYTGRDHERLKALDDIANRHNTPMVATNSVLMHEPERRALCDVVTCIREHCTIDEAGRRVQKNAERHLKSTCEMAALFADYPQAVARTLEITDRISFTLDELKYDYPDEVANGQTPQAELERLVDIGARARYPQGVPDKVRAMITHELKIVRELNYASYFLTVHDIVEFARSQDILCQGRGSAANSVLCYVLGITSVSPDVMEMVFERFVSAARGEPPDIDVDFEHERREEVIQYIYDKYGRDHASLTATVISYRARSALREVGKVFGLSQDATALLASQIWGSSSTSVNEDHVREIGLDARQDRLKLCFDLVQELIGFPRHLSQHVGGFVITKSRLDEIVPVENAAMDDRTVIEWDKDDIDALGILKVDVLGLGMLTCIRKAFALLETHYRQSWTLANLPQDDAAVYDMLCAADSIGVFQVESRAQMSFLPRMRPRTFYDLVIEVAIVRPGPIQGDMVHPYLRRRNGEEKVIYPSKALEEVLDRTLGVPLFQEQAMRIAIVGAGFAPDEADQLRRAMATFRRMGTIQNFRDKFITGMIANGYDADFAERCFRQIEGFGDYGFPESHAASFALLVYVSAWLKCHYPAAFACALLNSQPMGFYAPAQIVRDARDHGVEIRPVDVNYSRWECILEPAQNGFALRLGLRQIKGMKEDDAIWIEQTRGNGYGAPSDLWRRAGIEPATLNRLARADAFGSMGLSRRQALWEISAIKAPKPLALFDWAGEEEHGLDEPVELVAMSLGQEVVEDYMSFRLTLRAHPLKLLRRYLGRGVLARDLLTIAHNSRQTVSGLVLARQRPGTAKGVVFVTLEDETGSANIIIWRDCFERYRRIVMTARLMRVSGRLQREGIVAHLIADKIEDLSPLLDRLDEIDQPGQMDDLPGGRIKPDELKDPLARDRRGKHKSAKPRPMARPRHPREQAKVLFPSRDFH